MNHERMERAQFAAEVRRRGTLLSDEAVDDVCEALLELLDGGGVALELHEEITTKLRAEVQRLEALRVQGVEMGKAANQRIRELEGVKAKASSLRGVLESIEVAAKRVSEQDLDVWELRHEVRMIRIAAAAVRALWADHGTSRVVKVVRHSVVGFDANGSPVTDEGSPR